MWPRLRNSLVLALAVYAGLVLSACERAAAPAGNKDAVDVTVAPAVQKTVSLTQRAIGTVEALTTVDVRSRVDGQIVAVGFKEGATVAAGQMLFQIDPRPLQIQLQTAEASLQRNTALLENARILLEHNRNLRDKRFVSLEAWQQAETNYAALKATIAQDRTAIDAARLQLDFSTIKAPVSGRAGRILVHVGNVVAANNGPVLVTLHQMDPIYVTFAIPQQQLPALQQARRADAELQVNASTSATDPRHWQGRLTFVDNAVDKSSGSLTLKALFSNADNSLWPGVFIDVELQLGRMEGAIVVPAEAVQLGPKGHFVYVVDGEGQAVLREVNTTLETGTEIVVSRGITVGERVVTDGHVKLTPGSRVMIVTADRT